MNIHTQSLDFPRSSKRSLRFNISVRFRTKERGTRVKLCVKNGGEGWGRKNGNSVSFFPFPSFGFRSRSIFRAAKTGNPVPRSFFAPKPGKLAAQADAGYNVSCFHRLLRAKIKGEGGGKAKGKTKGEGENKGQRKRKS